MKKETISLDSIREFCATREVDLVMCSPPPPFTVCMRGEFDAYGDFFSILARDVEYVDLAGGLTVGDLVLVEIATLSRTTQKWRDVGTAYSGQALLIRSADAETWEAAKPLDLHLVVAGELIFEKGKDWDRAFGGRTPRS